MEKTNTKNQDENEALRTYDDVHKPRGGNRRLIQLAVADYEYECYTAR